MFQAAIWILQTYMLPTSNIIEENYNKKMIKLNSNGIPLSAKDNWNIVKNIKETNPLFVKKYWQQIVVPHDIC